MPAISRAHVIASPCLHVGRRPDGGDASSMVRAGGLEPPRARNAQRIFIPTTAFAADAVAPSGARAGLWSGLSLHLGVAALGAARLVSTPSRCRAWLGIAISQVPPNLGSSASAVSRASTQAGLSPLRLPVPPRPLDGSLYTGMAPASQGPQGNGCSASAGSVIRRAMQSLLPQGISWRSRRLWHPIGYAASAIKIMLFQ